MCDAYLSSPWLDYYRVLDKRESLMIILDNFNICIKHVVTPHMNPVNETIQMRSRNIWFQ